MLNRHKTRIADALHSFLPWGSAGLPWRVVAVQESVFAALATIVGAGSSRGYCELEAEYDAKVQK